MKTEYRILWALTAGIIVGGAFTYFALGRDKAGDGGLLFLPFTLFYGLIIAALFVCLEEILFGKPKHKKIAIVVLLIWLVWAVTTGFNHNIGSDESHPRYCDGVPAEQYVGPLPNNCRH